MGCCSTRQQFTIEDDIVLLENSLELQQITARKIDFISHQLSSEFILSELQFASMCSELNIEPDSQIFEFLMQFQDINTRNFDTQLLSTAGILLGSGEEVEKIDLLFKNYDKNTLGFLEISDIEKMITNIMIIAIDHVFEYAKKKFTDTQKQELETYRRELMKSKPILISVYSKSLIKDQVRVSFDMFLKAFQEADTAILFSSHNIRIVGKKMIKSFEELSENVNFAVKNELEIDTALARKMSMRMSKRRKQKAKRRNTTV